MKYQIFSENEWLYPDTELTDTFNTINLYAAKNSDVCFQVLTDKILTEKEKVAINADKFSNRFEYMQLKPVHVTKNTAKDYCVTDNYEEVKDIVTRKAPFDIFDVTKPIENNTIDAGRVGFYIRLNVSEKENVGVYNIKISIDIGGETITLPITLKIYDVVIPSVKNCNFHMVNWIYYERFPLHNYYNVEAYTEEYYTLLSEFLKQQIDMRSDYLMVPPGLPVKDENGEIIGFDFSACERVTKMAFELGFNKVLGYFLATWIKWNDANYFLQWNNEINIMGMEGYRQLKLYLTAQSEMIIKNGWQENFMQCICDEPQDCNATAYRALASLCRKFMPFTKILDAVETTEIYGAPDVWVVKQGTFEERKEAFQKIQAMGEDFWIYTCGFPGGKIMNRIMDLPLTVSRLLFWIGFKYNTNGFLHFGYHLHNPEREKDVCFVPRPTAKYSGGNSFIVYLGDNKPIYSVRAHQQRLGSMDFELLKMLSEKDNEKAQNLVNKLCRTYYDYEGSSELFDEVRQEVLESLC